MNEVPEGTGTRPERAASPARTGEPALWEAGSVRVPFSAVRIGLTPKARRQVSTRNVASATARQPPGGRESGGAVARSAAASERPERAERRSCRKRGLAPDPEARPSEGGPTGPTENEGCVVRWAVEADCCGALGCRNTDALLLAENSSGERRVLCADHVTGWVKR
jgi:hypothetical protein